MEIEQLMKQLAQGGITVQGDFVMEKKVEYEVNNVEQGGIGIQVVNGELSASADGKHPDGAVADHGEAHANDSKAPRQHYLFIEGDSSLFIQDPIFEGVNDSFEDWWNMYDKKRGKKKAQAKWNKLSKADQTACLLATPAYVASTPDVQYRLDPLTYLNGERWNDEIIQRPSYEQQHAINLATKAARILGTHHS